MLMDLLHYTLQLRPATSTYVTTDGCALIRHNGTLWQSLDMRIVFIYNSRNYTFTKYLNHDKNWYINIDVDTAYNKAMN